MEVTYSDERTHQHTALCHSHPSLIFAGNLRVEPQEVPIFGEDTINLTLLNLSTFV